MSFARVEGEMTMETMETIKEICSEQIRHQQEPNREIFQQLNQAKYSSPDEQRPIGPTKRYKTRATMRLPKIECEGCGRRFSPKDPRQNVCSSRCQTNLVNFLTSSSIIGRSRSIDATQRLARQIVIESDIDHGIYQGRALIAAKQAILELSKPQKKQRILKK